MFKQLVSQFVLGVGIMVVKEKVLPVVSKKARDKLEELKKNQKEQDETEEKDSEMQAPKDKLVTEYAVYTPQWEK